MTSEQIKREIAELEPQERKAWMEYKEAEHAIEPLNQAWSTLYKQLSYLRSKLHFADEQAKESAKSTLTP